MDEKVIEETKRFSTDHHYPANLSKNEKILKKRVQDFVVNEGGNIHYKCKMTGLTRMVICSKEEKERIFQVSLSEHYYNYSYSYFA